MRSEYTDWANTGRAPSNWVRKVGIGLVLLAPLGLAAIQPAAAASLVVGTPSNAGATSIPFGSPSAAPATFEYQQLYKATDFSGFSGPTGVVINSLGFATDGDAFNSTGLAGYTVTLKLGTASTAYNTPSTTFASNVGAGGLTTVFSGTQTSTLTNTGAFDLVFNTTPFVYNPGAGALLLDVTLTAPPTGAAANTANGGDEEFKGDNSGSAFYRVATLNTSSTTTANFASANGVVTQFGVITPESSGAANMAGALLAVGLGVLVIRLRKKTGVKKTSA